MIEIVFETHSTSVDNEAGVASGHMDAPLSAVGEVQAAELGLRYSQALFRDVYCSDLQRSHRTAQIAFGTRKRIRIHVDERLRECNYGLWNGVARSRVDSVRVNRVHTPFPEGESYTECTTRVRDFLLDLWTEKPSGRVLVVGHRATQYALEHILNGKRLQEAVAEPWSWQPGWTYTLDSPPTAAELIRP